MNRRTLRIFMGGLIAHLVGCSGLSDERLLSSLSEEEAREVCEERAASYEQSLEDSCLVSAVAFAAGLGGDSASCQQAYEQCLAMDVDFGCSDSDVAEVPPGCEASVGDVRNCSEQTEQMVSELASQISCEQIEAIESGPPRACQRLAACGAGG